MASITAANTIFAISIPGLIPAPVVLQGFTADDIFDFEAIETSEVIIGVDGFLSAGFVFALLKQNVNLQADSPSNLVFETLYAAEQTQRDKYFMSGTVIFPATKRTYTLASGVLSSYSPMPDAKKVLQPRRFGLTWQSVTAGSPS